VALGASISALHREADGMCWIADELIDL